MKSIIILALIGLTLSWNDLCHKDSDCATNECCVRDTFAWKNTPGQPARNICLKALKEENLCDKSRCECEAGLTCAAVYEPYGIVTKCIKEVRNLPRNDTCRGDSDCPGKQCCVWDSTLKQKGNICVEHLQAGGSCYNSKCACAEGLECMSFDERTQVQTRCDSPR